MFRWRFFKPAEQRHSHISFEINSILSRYHCKCTEATAPSASTRCCAILPTEHDEVDRFHRLPPAPFSLTFENNRIWRCWRVIPNFKNIFQFERIIGKSIANLLIDVVWVRVVVSLSFVLEIRLQNSHPIIQWLLQHVWLFLQRQIKHVHLEMSKLYTYHVECVLSTKNSSTGDSSDQQNK